MTPSLRHWYLARITLETRTPLSIATGASEGVFDMALVQDANGLPAIPGSSLAGVLRHLYGRRRDSSEKELFGWQAGDAGAPSVLQVSWGAIQDSKGRPVEGLLLGSERQRRLADPLLAAVLAAVQAPVIRDRVRLTHRGVAADQGKFERAVLPAGFRFSAELGLWSAVPDDPRWGRLLGLLADPRLRLGGGVRAGLGRIEPVSVQAAAFDLGTQQGRDCFTALKPGLAAIEGLSPVRIAAEEAGGGLVSAELHLTPRAFWRVGQGEEPGLVGSDGKPADLLPKLEQRVTWDGSQARPALQQLLLPASSLKGALAHRVAFHANRLEGRWADEVSRSTGRPYDKSEQCPAVRNLFGWARDDTAEQGERRDDQDSRPGQAGRVLIDDAYARYDKKDLKLMLHNAIDRFTGGVREHMLFAEELVWKQGVSVCIGIDTAGVEDRARQALRLALDDLCAGRLSLGAGAAKGHGFFTGKLKWSDDGAWIDKGIEPASEADTGEEIAA